MKKFMLIFLIFCLSNSCHEKRAETITFIQPDTMLLDTNSRFFPLIEKYIQENRKDKNAIDKYVMVINNSGYYTHMWLSAIQSFSSFNHQIPNYYFSFKGNLFFVFTGIDKVVKFDSNYITTIKNKFPENEKFVSNGSRCWEIVYNVDTCYYFDSKYPLIPYVEGLKFQGP